MQEYPNATQISTTSSTSPKHDKRLSRRFSVLGRIVKSKDRIFDVLMTRGLSRGDVLDFKPYHPEWIPSYSRTKSSCQPSLGAVHLSSVLSTHLWIRPQHTTHQSTNTICYQSKPSSGQNIGEFSDLWKINTVFRRR